MGIPTITDRLVQAGLKLVSEPIFEAGFDPCSYGFRPNRRAQDAIAEIHHLGTLKYHWVLEADIEACFDSIDHSALMQRLRQRIGDKRVLASVKAFLKAGVLSEHGQRSNTLTGPPQGGILSPLLANIALLVLDEHFTGQWQQMMATPTQHQRRRRHGQANWRLIRYADDFVVMVHGPRGAAEGLRDQVAAVLAPLGLGLAEVKTQVVHIDEGFDFLGFRIQRYRKQGSHKRYVCTFPARRAVDSVKQKVNSADPQNIIGNASGGAGSHQRDPARMDQLLQARGVQARVQLSQVLHRDTSGTPTAPPSSSLEVEGHQPAIRQQPRRHRR